MRLSNLMALDARALGNWGCAPELYPEILEKVLAGSIDVVSARRAAAALLDPAALDDVARTARRRIVLTPDGSAA